MKRSIEIQYGVHPSPFGWCVVGVMQESICYLAFIESNQAAAAEHIKKVWPEAHVARNDTLAGTYATQIFDTQNHRLPLKTCGTPFQEKVWRELQKIPAGKTVSYSYIANKIGTPKAVRAVGTACGKNNIAYIIPCHRVLTADGKIGGYRWGIARKKAMLAAEAPL